MPTPSRRAACALSLVVVLAAVSVTAGQMRYWTGQNVVPVFEGWERNPDGTFSMVVGYYNRNVEEALDMPIGPNNNIEPGGPDQGQPTFFAPGRHMYVFRVKVPKDFDPKKRLIWTLTIRGKTEAANLFLLPEWETGIGVMIQNGVGGGAGGRGEYNQPPTITGGPAQAIKFGDTATLTASVMSGLLKPSPERPAAAPSGPSGAGQSGRARGPGRGSQLRVEWLQYRGPVGGRVTFTPQSSPVIDGKAPTTASFSAPGQYVVRGFATEGPLTAPADVAVSVNPASSAEAVR